ncbi:UNKNOWN [Stylonychia lemnae]|uniref:Uncharacterized protein n=1 Tax=Stylonychia lemnae TaxID=5949 RepID=A0A078A0Q1_STYLE|nr:UNKNOWN [Stylonychia lemnae]|eukprot:CDW74374.1 UNKNOWN [Stylonychia lemnae]
MDGTGNVPGIASQTQQNASVNNSYFHMNNLKQSHQVYQQQQKDAQLTQKLVGIIDTLQDELTFKTLQVNQLMEENLKLKQMQGLGISNDGNIQGSIDNLLSNPSFRAALFERLSKQNF